MPIIQVIIIIIIFQFHVILVKNNVTTSFWYKKEINLNTIGSREENYLAEFQNSKSILSFKKNNSSTTKNNQQPTTNLYTLEDLENN